MRFILSSELGILISSKMAGYASLIKLSHGYLEKKTYAQEGMFIMFPK